MSDWELELIDLPNPCTVPWESMNGDERVRFCKHCSKNVYNLSDMSRTEARNLMISSEGTVCISMLKRADGTVVTDECPPILRPVRNAGRRILTAATAVLAFLITAGVQASKAAPDATDTKSKKAGSSSAPGCASDQAKSTSGNEPVRLGGAPLPMRVPANWTPAQNSISDSNPYEAVMPPRKFSLSKSKEGDIWTARALKVQSNDPKWNAKNELPPDMESYLNYVLRKLKFAYKPAAGQEIKASIITFSINKNGSISNPKIETHGGALSDDLAMSAVKHAAPFKALPASAPETLTVHFDAGEL